MKLVTHAVQQVRGRHQAYRVTYHLGYAFVLFTAERRSKTKTQAGGPNDDTGRRTQRRQQVVRWEHCVRIASCARQKNVNHHALQLHVTVRSEQGQSSIQNCNTSLFQPTRTAHNSQRDEVSASNEVDPQTPMDPQSPSKMQHLHNQNVRVSCVVRTFQTMHVLLYGHAGGPIAWPGDTATQSDARFNGQSLQYINGDGLVCTGASIEPNHLALAQCFCSGGSMQSSASQPHLKYISSPSPSTQPLCVYLHPRCLLCRAQLHGQPLPLGASQCMDYGAQVGKRLQALCLSTVHLHPIPQQ